MVEGDAKGQQIQATVVVVASGKQAEEIRERVVSGIKETLQLPEEPGIVNDETTEKLWPGICKAAEKLMIAKKLGQNILLRFHGDADGIAGAFALTSVVRARTYQQNSAVYSVKDALRDIGTAGQEGPSMVVLLDFASNENSAEAVNLIIAAGIEVIIIDHHPAGEKNRELMLNSSMISPEASKYTAGYLASEIAVACGLQKERGTELAKIACTGDKSTILEHDENDVKKAMVFDYLAAHTFFGNNLDFYKKVMGNESLFASIAQQAKDSIEEAADRAMAIMKQSDGVVSFALDNIVTKGEWPPASKITTCVFERLSKEEPLVCIGQTERSLIIRLNDAAAERGLSANSLATEIVESMPDFVIGGGGHVKAGAIRVRKEFSKDVLNELIRKIKEKRGN